jgi:AraC-like DNA-binding protein
MFRATNDEPGEHRLQAVHAFAPEEVSTFGPKLLAGSPANAAAQGTYLRGGLPPSVVRRVREHIESNIDQRIKVETLARLANLSVSYFLRAFKQSVGVTPHDYLMRRRIERTMELMSGTDMPLSEIALAAGFADQSHCARRFRQHVGMSPRDYRWATPRGVSGEQGRFKQQPIASPALNLSLGARRSKRPVTERLFLRDALAPLAEGKATPGHPAGDICPRPPFCCRGLMLVRDV